MRFLNKDKYTFTLSAPPSPPQKRHKHQCLICDCIWEHGEECAGSDKEHTCPRCGGINFWNFRKYNGPKPVTLLVRDKYTFHL